MLSGCAKKEEQATTTLNIGYQKYGILPILKARGDLEKVLKDQGVQVKWVEFPAGPQLLEGLNVGSVSLGEAGEAPPIFAQAANPNLVYVANQPPAPTAEAPEMEQPEAGDQTAATGDNVGESAEAGQDNAGQAMASANASLSATVNLSGEQLGQVLNTVDGVYQTAGTVVEGVTGGVLGTVQNVANMTSGANLAADMASTGSLDIAGLATANLAGNLSATASMMNAGQLGAITAMTSSLIQNVIASRPASLTGLLR